MSAKPGHGGYRASISLHDLVFLIETGHGAFLMRIEKFSPHRQTWRKYGQDAVEAHCSRLTRRCMNGLPSCAA